MADVIDVLREEHRNIARLLAILEHQIEIFAQAGTPDYEILHSIADYFLEYPDLCHHPKENVVYRRLRERFPHDAAALNDLESEHRDVSERARRFHEMVTALHGEPDTSRETIVDTGRIFISAERRHMAMEENTFFPLAEIRLTPEDWSHIDNDLDEARDPLFGDRVEAEFRNLSEKLLRWEQESLDPMMSDRMDKDDHQYILSREAFDGVIFDLDGVITDTASLHCEAWKRVFDAFLDSLEGLDGARPAPFDIDTDYRDYVDGRPRYDGVRCFLASREITLPEGAVDDGSGNRTVHALGNRKNVLFRQLLAERGPVPIRSTIAFIHGLRSQGFRVAVVTSSRNASAVLDGAGITDLFDVTLDGIDTEIHGLAGKPDPAVFLEAARRLGVEAARTAVVEDAVAGVRAGRGGRFGCTIGLARRTDREALWRGGADVVVASLSEIQFDGEDGTGCTPMATLPSAMERISEIVGTARPRRLAVFLDYDGTLTPIVSRPDLAVLSEHTRDVLQKLLPCATVAVISGRDIADVRALVDVEGIVYAGDHGFRIATPDGQEVCSEHGAGFRPILDQMQGELTIKLADIPGVLFEPKFASLAVHYRLVTDADVVRVEAAVDRVVASHPGFRKSLGKKVFEIQPDIDWDKGRALLWLVDSLGIAREEGIIIYMGDDLTDEAAFRALPPNGVGIVVRDGETRPTAAQYQLEDPDEVRAFLVRLADLGIGSS